MKEKNKTPYIKYDESADFEYAKGCIRVYLPTEKGYVNFNVVHSVRENIFADVWRLGQAFGYNDDLCDEYKLTPFGAEWDMAVMIEGRDDFIGGSNHGDEISSSIEITIDGESCGVDELKDLCRFEDVKIRVLSTGFDPNDHVTEALKHLKEYTIKESGVSLYQEVKWLNDYNVGSSYLAMMPPLKTLTESYFTDTDPLHKKINGQVIEKYASKATVFGENSGVTFTMSTPLYPKKNDSGRFLITDNSGNAYNKMYFFAARADKVKAGEVWESVTEYTISATK